MEENLDPFAAPKVATQTEEAVSPAKIVADTLKTLVLAIETERNNAKDIRFIEETDDADLLRVTAKAHQKYASLCDGLLGIVKHYEAQAAAPTQVEAA